jgi:tetratricopeptide (TPR) repeat protein
MHDELRLRRPLDTATARDIMPPSREARRFQRGFEQILRKGSSMNRTRKPVLLAIAAIWLATGCKPDPAEEHRNKAINFANQSQWKEAIDEYALSLQADPKQEKLWEEKAYAHMQLQENEPFEQAMVKLAELKPDNAKKAEIYRNIGGVFIQKGLADEAEKNFMKAVALNPKDDQSLGWIAEIWAQRGGARAMGMPAKPEALDKALEYTDKVIALKPDETAGYINKRIALTKYIDYWQQQKNQADKDAIAEKDKEKRKEFLAKSDAALPNIEKYKKMLDDTTAKLAEAAKKPQPTPAAPGAPAKK